jgi:hypothetical protein
MKGWLPHIASTSLRAAQRYWLGNSQGGAAQPIVSARRSIASAALRVGAATAAAAAASTSSATRAESSCSVTASSKSFSTSHSGADVCKAAGEESLGSVTRLSVGRSATTASSWETVPNWCELCSEPVNAWEHHVGKREHLCLEMTLNAALAYPRSWYGPDLWWRTELFREHYAKRPRGQPRTPSKNVQRLLRAGMVVPAVMSPMNIFYEAFDKNEPAARREEILLLLTHLNEKGLLTLSSDTLTSTAYEGQLVLYKELMPLLARVFPDAEVRYCSAMTMMIVSAFNLDTVYFLCGLEVFMTPELMRGLGGATAASSRQPLAQTKGAGEAGSSDDRKSESSSSDDTRFGDEQEELSSSDEEGVSLNRTAELTRAILGCLRWSLEPGTVSPPPAISQGGSRYAYYSTLAARAARLLLAEIVYNRLSEYVFRVEDLLRSDFGQNLLRARGGIGSDTIGTAQIRVLHTRRLVPQLSNYGIMQFTSGVGLRAAKVMGTTGADRTIQQQEALRAARLKRHAQGGRVATSDSLPLSRSVRAL